MSCRDTSSRVRSRHVVVCYHLRVQNHVTSSHITPLPGLTRHLKSRHVMTSHDTSPHPPGHITSPRIMSRCKPHRVTSLQTRTTPAESELQTVHEFSFGRNVEKRQEKNQGTGPDAGTTESPWSLRADTNFTETRSSASGEKLAQPLSRSNKTSVTRRRPEH